MDRNTKEIFDEQYSKKIWSSEIDNRSIKLRQLFYFVSPYTHILHRFIKKKGKLLDAGCGTGKISIEYSKKGFDVVGIDINEIAIELAKSKKSDATFFCSDLCNTTFESESFDYIVCFDVLEHVSTPEEALKELKRLLKPSGTLILGYETSDRVDEKAIKENLANSTIVSRIKGEDMKKIFAKYFDLKYSFYFGFFRKYYRLNHLIDAIYKIPLFVYVFKFLETMFGLLFKNWPGINLFLVGTKRG